MGKSVIAITIFALIAFASMAFAGSISVTTKADSVVMNSSTVNFSVTVSNSGDEPARDARISLLLPEGFSANSADAGAIADGGEYTGIFNITADQARNGTYGFGILIEYKDANQYPFSAVSPNTIIFSAPTSSRVTGTLQRGSVGDRGSIILSMSNNDDVAHNIDMRLYMPKELSSLEAWKNITLAAGEKRQETFVIDNLGALDGSNYAVFAVLSYDDGDQHYSHITGNSISIGHETTSTTVPAQGSSELKTNDLLLMGLTVVVVAVIVYNLKVKGWKRKDHGETSAPREGQSQ